jgi:hypothetical protein
MALLTKKAPKGPLNRKSTDESSTLLFVRLEVSAYHDDVIRSDVTAMPPQKKNIS